MKKAIGFGVIALILSFTTVVAVYPVSAQTTVASSADEATLIAQLEAIIMQLIDQLKARGFSVGANGAVTRSTDPSTPAPVVFCHNFNQNLKFGDDLDENGNGDMKYLKQVLRMEGFTQDLSESRNTLHALFGESTAEAVVSFQKKYGISQTGFVGPITRAKLNSLYGCGNQAPNPHADGVICTADEMHCPDGSYVSRVAPSCQFRSCPSSTTFRHEHPHEPPIAMMNAVINGVSGPQSLNINQQGAWTVNAYDPTGGSLSYSVVWGDETSLLSNATEAPWVQTSTFTHTYGRAAIFSPRFYVRNANASQVTSLSVNVGSTNANPSVTVVYPNGGEVWQMGKMYEFKWNSLGLEKVIINLSKGDIGYGTLDPVTASLGRVSYLLPSSLPAGQYKVFIADGTGKSIASDYSDNYFTITASSTYATF